MGGDAFLLLLMWDTYTRREFPLPSDWVWREREEAWRWTTKRSFDDRAVEKARGAVEDEVEA